ncbi:unnamed protein product [Closterium sp. NIES-65]|nr:unnamed protein product [Closterium sp. NIES-65]
MDDAGVPAVTAPQEEEAMEVLRQRAAELQVARPWHEVAPGVRVGLAGRHQQVNASLAVSLCRQWAIRSGREEEARAVDEALANKTLPLAYIKGLGGASWPGRCEILQDCPAEPGQAGSAGGQLTFFLDGAHTVESMELHVVCSTFSHAALIVLFFSHCPALTALLSLPSLPCSHCPALTVLLSLPALMVHHRPVSPSSPLCPLPLILHRPPPLSIILRTFLGLPPLIRLHWLGS